MTANASDGPSWTKLSQNTYAWVFGNIARHCEPHYD